MVQYIRSIGLALLLSVGFGSMGKAGMFKIIKLAIVGVIFSPVWANIVLATNCQNEKITQFEQIDFSPLKTIDGDINGDGLTDKLLYNLADGWITLDFYVENASWDTCRPNLILKLVSSDTFSEVRGWDLETTINEKGSVRTRSCYYGGSRGICHDEYNFVLRYIDENVRIIGYDHREVGINYPSIEFSMNLLTGRSIVTLSPGILTDAVRNPKTKILKIDYGRYILHSGDVIKVPEELKNARRLLFNKLDK